jgi:hypothetical protein
VRRPETQGIAPFSALFTGDYRVATDGTPPTVFNSARDILHGDAGKDFVR